jgi:hypothetical protein
MRLVLMILTAAFLLLAVNMGAEELTAPANNLILEGELIDSNKIVINASPEQCCDGIRGNADGDGSEIVNMSDYTYLLSYCFMDGSAPPCDEEGNADGDVDDDVNILDVIYLYSYLFGFPQGPAPPACP